MNYSKITDEKLKIIFVFKIRLLTLLFVGVLLWQGVLPLCNQLTQSSGLNLIYRMDDILQATNSLEIKLKAVVENYEFLKRENELLLENISVLQGQLSDRDERLQEQQKRYDLLKVAKTMVGSSENTRDTKLKINALIRHIDSCIVRLNGL